MNKISFRKLENAVIQILQKKHINMECLYGILFENNKIHWMFRYNMPELYKNGYDHIHYHTPHNIIKIRLPKLELTFHLIK